MSFLRKETSSTTSNLSSASSESAKLPSSYSDSQCNLQRPGKSQSDLTKQCLNYCEGALDIPGDLNGYDPFSRQGTTNSVELENENQAAAWMNCVDQQACERLDYRSGQGGYCQPVW